MSFCYLDELIKMPTQLEELELRRQETLDRADRLEMTLTNLLKGRATAGRGGRTQGRN